MFGAWVVAGCGAPRHASLNPVGSSSQSSIALPQAVQMTNSVRTFSGRGIVKELPPSNRSLVINHEAVAGLMPKMTMEFTVRDARQLRGLKVGDAITFQLKITDDESWVEEIRLARGPLPDTAATPPPPSQAFVLGSLKPGDKIPDFEFQTEDGRSLHLSSFQGKVVAFTFIFTRCPVPDFCPRMSHQFGKARGALLQRSAPSTNWQFLSISFDPEFDTPEILAKYAQGYRGANAKGWLFAVIPPNVIDTLAQILDLHITRDNGSLAHNLRTVVLDRQQRLVRRLDGNQWTAEELLEAIDIAAQAE